MKQKKTKNKEKNEMVEYYPTYEEALEHKRPGDVINFFPTRGYYIVPLNRPAGKPTWL